VHVISLGGTITMHPSENRTLTPAVNAEDLVADLPELSEVARIRTETLATEPSEPRPY
jgi:L-asparaginase/Glu-tRNA(Gln) amidotransferase subunit D